MAKATITRVSLANTANGERIALNLSNGDTQWYPLSYIQKLLTANFLGGMRPTVLIGTEVEYSKQQYQIGDAVTDEKGVAVVPAILHKKAGTKLLNFTFGEIVGNVTKVDEMKANAEAMAAVLSKGAAAFGIKPKVAVIEPEPATEPETSAVVADEVTV